MISASLTAVIIAIAAQPVNAGYHAGVSFAVPAPNAATASASAANPFRTASQIAALNRQIASQNQAGLIASYRAALGTAATGTIAARVTATQLAAVNAGYKASAYAVRIANIPDGLVTSADGSATTGLAPIKLIQQAINAPDAATAHAYVTSALSANDKTGSATWQGAGLPTQTVTNGQTTVSITQTDQRALLSWNSFDVGANTTLQFTQKQGGVAQPGWTALNRVVNTVNPTTILGNIKADATVVILNQNGVLFGAGSQVNAYSLVASSLEVGNAFRAIRTPIVSNKADIIGTTLSDRNANYLKNGLFALNQGDPTTVADPHNTLDGEFSYLFSADHSGQTIDSDFISAAPSTISLATGASITASGGGFILLAGPNISNAGTLSAVDGQASLQAGQYIAAVSSSGNGASVDPNVRGYLLRSVTPLLVPATPTVLASGTVTNTGTISSTRGYISLGADNSGTVENDGLLTATTSVSRNGKIGLYAGNIILGGNAADKSLASAITITPDTNGETIPQGDANNLPSFQRSQVEIGSRLAISQDGNNIVDPALLTIGVVAPTNVTIGQNSLIDAPNANISINPNILPAGAIAPIYIPNSIDIQAGATIDVSGLKNVQLTSAANSIAITPVKRNELQDTPNFREVSLGDNFTLNGSTLYIDPRVSGVRADGVKWVGSPLLAGQSIVSSQPETVQQLMTKGGTLQLNAQEVITTKNINNSTDTNGIVTQGGTFNTSIANGHVSIAQGALIDFSGGWSNYAAGFVHTSNLITADGRIVNISQANPNDHFVSVANGFTQAQPNFQSYTTYNYNLLAGEQFNPSYDQGADAGAFTSISNDLRFDGSIFGNAYAGARQLIAAQMPTAASAQVPGDVRKLQATPYQLPAGGDLDLTVNAVQSVAPIIVVDVTSLVKGVSTVTGRQLTQATNNPFTTSDIIIYHGSLNGDISTNPQQTFLNDATLSAAGLSSLSLSAAAVIDPLTGNSLTPAGNLTLLGTTAPTLTIPQPNITFDTSAPASITLANGGQIKLTATTIDLAGNIIAPSGGITASATGATSLTPTDPKTGQFLLNGATSLGDLNVSGVLSTAGLWTNDYLANNQPQGGAWTNGGSISLNVAAGYTTNLSKADVVNHINIASAAALNVASGGYIAPTGALTLTATGGNVTFNDAANYLIVPPATSAGYADAGIVIADGASLKGFGFGGGGTFKVIAPSISFGSDNQATYVGTDGVVHNSLIGTDKSVHVGLDFLSNTGFGTLDLEPSKTTTLEILNGGKPIFYNGPANEILPVAQTSAFTIHNGETLNLSQTLLPSVLDATQRQTVQTLASGTDIATTLTPSVPIALWDQKAANLTIGQSGELGILTGGAVTGAPGANLKIGRLYNAGTIILPGANISSSATFSTLLPQVGIGAINGLTAGLNNVLGGGQVNGQYDSAALLPSGLILTSGVPFTYSFTETDITPNKIYSNPTNLQLLAGLFPQSVNSKGNNLYATPLILGRNSALQAIYLAPDSTTDLSGIAVSNPRGPLINGAALALGKLYSGGLITTTGVTVTSTTVDNKPTTGTSSGYQFVADAGANVNLNGTTASFDVQNSSGNYVLTPQWSNAGSLASLSGGSIAGANITAFGGTTQALGGTLIWSDPVIRNSLSDGLGGNKTLQLASTGLDYSNVITTDFFSNIRTASRGGFDSFVIQGNPIFDGANVNLSLGRSLVVSTGGLPFYSRNQSGSFTAGSDSGNSLILSGTANTVAHISAPYISFNNYNALQPALGNVSPENKVGSLVAKSTNADLTFTAGAGGIDFFGFTGVGNSVGKVKFATPSDVRFTGVAVDSSLNISSRNVAGQLVTVTPLTGAIQTAGDLIFDANRIYTTTGTGNLQAKLEGITDHTNTFPFTLIATGAKSSITFGSDYLTPNTPTPLSAGSYLSVQAPTIIQNGYVAGPLGEIDFGSNSTVGDYHGVAGTIPVPITTSLSFGAQSTTIVSGAGLNVPYGTTQDQKTYFFTPTVGAAVSTTPVSILSFAAKSIDFAAGSLVDGRGGGAVYATEFVAGVGGSHNILSRFNNDQYTSNSFNVTTGVGYQYPDKRQVYAIVPTAEAQKLGLTATALYDPILSADYNGSIDPKSNSVGPTNLYGVQAGLSVTLDTAPGVVGGQYLLLPGQYALLPGAYRLVENVGAKVPAVGAAETQLDGSIIVGGVYSTAGTGYVNSTRTSFLLENNAAFTKYSTFALTDAATNISNQAAHAGNAVPRLPLDSARTILAPLTSLRVEGKFLTDAVSGGKGAQFDISSANLVIGTALTAAQNAALTAKVPTNYLLLSNSTIANLNPNSLLLGGSRIDNKEGTTTLAATANSVIFNSDALVQVPELLAVVGTDGTIAPAISVANGAKLVAPTGIAVSDPRTGDYLFSTGTAFSFSVAALRVANGAERALRLPGDVSTQPYRSASLIIGSPISNGPLASATGATLAGDDIAFASTQKFSIDKSAKLAATNIALDSSRIIFSKYGAIDPATEAQLAAAQHLTLRSFSSIVFSSNLSFNNLTLDTPTLQNSSKSNITIIAKDVVLKNYSSDIATRIGKDTNTLTLNTNSLTFGSGKIGVLGFDGGVNLSAANGIYYEDTGGVRNSTDPSGNLITNPNLTGGFNLGNAPLTITTPFIVDRAFYTTSGVGDHNATTAADRSSATQAPVFAFDTTGSVTISAAGTSATPLGDRAPGASFSIGENLGTSTNGPEVGAVKSVSITDTTLLATAGLINIRTAGDKYNTRGTDRGNITLVGKATLATPSYSKVFGDVTDPVTVSAPGGTINLTSLHGNITLPNTSSLIVDGGLTAATTPQSGGTAGTIDAYASEGGVDFSARLNPFATGPRTSSLNLDSQFRAFDLGGFVTHYGSLFEGALSIRSGLGDLTLTKGQDVRATSVNFTADGGVLNIDSVIDTSGADIKMILGSAGSTDLSGATSAGLALIDHLATQDHLNFNGGNIALYGNKGVTLGANTLLNSHTTGYATLDPRVATAGSVTVGIGCGMQTKCSFTGVDPTKTAHLLINAGAQFDVGAVRADGYGARFLPVPPTSNSTVTTNYTYAAADTGGAVTLIAPVITTTTAGQSIVNITTPASFTTGQTVLQIEGVKHYNLDALEQIKAQSKAKGFNGITHYNSIAGGVTLPNTVYLNTCSTAACDSSAPGVNLLSDYFSNASGTSIPYFVQNFALATVDGSATPAGAVARPSVSLDSAHNITLTTNWNLAAATVDQAGAAKAGDLLLIPQLSTVAKPVYYVASGAEGDLLQNYSHFLYRVGGKALGAAPVIALHAAQNLNIGITGKTASISDGTFTFRDVTDPNFLTYELGGGTHRFDPGILVSNLSVGTSGASSSLTLDLTSFGRIQTSPINIYAPFNALSNSAAAGSYATTLATGGSYDPLGNAELFPLLNGQALDSTSIGLVGGAGAQQPLSADAVHIDRGTNANVNIIGINTQKIVAQGSAKPILGTQFQFADSAGSGATMSSFGASVYDVINGLRYSYDNSLGTINNFAANQGLESGAVTTLTLSASFNSLILQNQITSAAFKVLIATASNFGGGDATMPAAITQMDVSLADALTFLKIVQANSALVNTLPGNKQYRNTAGLPDIGNQKLNYLGETGSSFAPGNGSYFPENNIITSSYVRSGNGAINVAGGQDISLLTTPQPRSTSYFDTSAATQYATSLGGAAIYTVGQRAAASQVGQIVGLTSGQLLSLISTSPFLVSAPPTTSLLPDLINGLTSNGASSGNLAHTGSTNGALAQNGGSVSLTAGRDVLGRGTIDLSKSIPQNDVGLSVALAATSNTKRDVEFAISPSAFTDGIGALGGGNLTINAGRNASDLTIALDSSATTVTGTIGTLANGSTLNADPLGLTNATLNFGSGGLLMNIGNNLLGNRITVLDGSANIEVGGSVNGISVARPPYINGGLVPASTQINPTTIQLANATLALNVRGSVTLGSISDVISPQNAGLLNAAYFTPIAGASVTANGDVTVTGDVNYAASKDGNGSVTAYILPPSLNVGSLNGNIILENLGSAVVPYLLAPSAVGQLNLFAGGVISGGLNTSVSPPTPVGLEIALLDRIAINPITGGAAPAFPFFDNSTSAAALSALFSQDQIHKNDPYPVRIYSGGSINNLALFTPKQTRLSAGIDLVNTYFTGQNLNVDDTTRITAGRDIIGTAAVGNIGSAQSPLSLPYVVSNTFIVGGAGLLDVEAGRDLGPFLSSATVGKGTKAISYAGGILSVGGLYDPYLTQQSADITTLFGVANGVNYNAFTDIYLNPANSAKLDGALFVQTSDFFGNVSADRSKPIYAPVLAQWLQSNEPTAYAAATAGQSFATPDALTSWAYGHFDALYSAFQSVNIFKQHQFLINNLYFNELGQSALPTILDATGKTINNPSYQKYVRGYRAVQTLFPPSLGYTDNLASYTTSPGTINAEHPLGVPTRNLVNGVPQKAAQVHTGDADFTLATLQTYNNASISILGPGGSFSAGSTDRTSDKIQRTATGFARPYADAQGTIFQIGGQTADNAPGASQITSFPLRYEGVITIGGGNIYSFTDGNLELNQSRLFVEGAGNITAWSSNQDVAAGQGPRTSTNFPPVSVRCDANGYCIVDPGANTAGAGIAANDPFGSIILEAPVGLVDAGDAGVRAAGNIFVAALRVGNADNFKASGSISGVPSGKVAAAPAISQSAAAAVTAALARVNNNDTNKKSEITVQIDPCADPNNPDPKCAKPQQ